MLKLLLTPDQDTYAVAEGETVIATKVGGGPPRQRQDLLDAETTVEAQYTLTPAEYQYFRAFYNFLNKGATSFLCDLIIETPGLRTYVARFKPGTWKLSSVKGISYKVKVTMNVSPNDEGLDYAALVEAWEPEPYEAPPDPVDWGIE